MSRRIPILTMVSVSVALAACSKAPSASENAPADVTVASDRSSAEATKPDARNALAAHVSQLAYRYQLSYRLDGDAIARVQDSHVALCRDLGPARCQLVAMERSAKDDSYPVASLKLRVATAIAPAFAARLGQAVASAGGRALDTNVAADDVSKEIVDTQARIRQRELLVQRMTEILRTRDGKLADLVETERSIAQAQEELDQAKAWLAELQGRVALSDFDIRYDAVSVARVQGMSGRLAESASTSLGAFLSGIQVLVTVAIFLAPWTLLAVGGFWAARTVRRRWFAPAV